MTTVPDRRTGVDSLYAWRLAFLSTFCIVLGGGAIYLPVVALKEIAAEFGDRRAVPSMAYMLGFSAMGVGGVFMGWLAQTLVQPVSFHQFIDSGFRGSTLKDFLPPTFKTAVFGLIIGLVACFQGMRTRGGAEGVGRAATNSVVLASLFVILADVVLVKFILVVFH